ncbi:MAG: hypothetical protein ACOCUS_03690 [Polyangiales bacterium]
MTPRLAGAAVLAVGLGLLCLAAACAGSATGRAERPLEVEGFCAAWSEAVCEPARDCGCMPEGMGRAECAEAVASACPLAEGSRLRAGVRDGDYVYDPIAARGYVRRVRSTDCNMRGYLGDATLGQLDTLFGTIDGTKEIGESCTPGALPDACREGLCDPEKSTCFALVGEGEHCDATHACDPAASGMASITLRCSEEQICEQAPMDAPATTLPGSAPAPACDLLR